MKNFLHSPFVTIFQNEVLFNTKRVAPYAMAILFGGNALLWWGWGPASGRGWASNSDFFIAGVLPVYSFMTLPLFTALLMADPVIRDFRAGVAQLILSKPVSRGEYLLGKFFGNFFVLVCCQAAFVLTLFVLQAFSRPGMIVQEVKVLPYLKHFLVFVVLSHMVLAACYFTVGTLTRNAKIVYGLGVSFYPLYISYQVFLLKSLPSRWRSTLDPLLMNWGKINSGRSAEWANQLIVTYDSDLIVNRALMILIAAICMTIVYVRFAITERAGLQTQTTLLNLSTSKERIYFGDYSLQEVQLPPLERARTRSYDLNTVQTRLTEVSREIGGWRPNLGQLIAVTRTEFRLLSTERSLIVILPLAVFLSTMELAFWKVVPQASYSAAYAGRTANALLLFVLGIAIFYTGEAMQRDREVKIEAILWSAPAPNCVFLFSKFLATLLLTFALVGMVVMVAIALQILKGDRPFDASAYLMAHTVILIPTAASMIALSLVLNVVLRDKHLAYVVTIGASGGLLYLYTQGYNHWLYNPVLYGLWTETNLISGASRILALRIYCLAFTILCLWLAHVFFARRSTRGEAWTSEIRKQ